MYLSSCIKYVALRQPSVIIIIIIFKIDKLTSEKLQKKERILFSETNETIMKQVSRFTHHTHHTHQVLPVTM